MRTRPILMRLCVLAAITQCCGCALLLRRPGGAVVVAPGVSFRLLAPTEIGEPVSMFQEIRATYGGEQYIFFAQTEVTANQVSMAGLTPFGSRAFLLTRSNNRTSFEAAPFFDAPLQPDFLLACYQLAHWPRAAVEAGLRGRGVHFDETAGATRSRRITRRGRELIGIEYGDGDGEILQSIVFNHEAWGFTLVFLTKELVRL